MTHGNLVMNTLRSPGLQALGLGVLALLLAGPVALLIDYLNDGFSGNPYVSTTLIWGCFGLILILVPAIYLSLKRGKSDPGTVALIALATILVLLSGIYFYWVSFQVFFPADLLIWAETEFVSDILKFKEGYPLYSAQTNNESFIYPPGTQLLTYAISWLLGNSFSLALYRSVQVGFTLLAAVVAFFSCWWLVKLAAPNLSQRTLLPLGIIALPAFLLIATNSITNPYVNYLHNDGLNILISVFAYFLLIRYTQSGDKRLLVLMALVPAVGLLVKQNLVVWGLLYVIYLAVFDWPRSFSRVGLFSAGALLGVLAVFGVSYLLWGDNYLYWVFTVPANVKVSVIRSFQHVLDVWPYFAIGLAGGLVLLRGRQFNSLLGLWAIWLVLMLSQAYTSGNAYTVHHMGPGSLIAGVWFVAGLTKVWVDDLPRVMSGLSFQKWFGYGVAVSLLALLCSGLGLVRIPVQPITDEYDRYINAIEQEFAGEPAENILLDAGTWVYFNEGVLAKDRVTTIVDRQNGQTGDFSGIINRLEEQHYSKILVRRFHAPDFWYDQLKYPMPTGIRPALAENYQEVGVIEGVEGEERYLFSDISILVPRPKEDTQLSTRSTSDSY